MIKKTIKFEDYDGNPRTEDHWFNLSKSELSELQLMNSGGLEGMTRKMIESNDDPEIVKFFKKLVLMSYGERQGDAKNFFKEDEEGRPLSRKFKQTAAYDALWMELVTDTQAAIDFFNGVVPKEMSSVMQKQFDKLMDDTAAKNENKA